VAKVAIVFGILLIGLGLGGYFGTGSEHITALIPAYFGAALLVLGLLALKDSLRKHAMHLAAMVGLLGVIGALFRPVKTLLSGGSFADPVPPTLQGIMALLCAVFVGLCVKSFIDVRRRRAQQTGV